MHLGVLTLEIAIYDAFSLKDKRRAVKSLKDRIRQRFNVAVAEVDNLDVRRHATIAVVSVSNDAADVHARLDKIVDFTQKHVKTTLIDFSKEML